MPADRRRRGTPRRARARCAPPAPGRAPRRPRRSASAVAGPTAATEHRPEGPGVAQRTHEAVHRVDRRQDHPLVLPHGRPPRPAARHRRPRGRPGGSAAAPRAAAPARSSTSTSPGRAGPSGSPPPCAGQGPGPRRRVGAERGHGPDDDDGGRAQLDVGQPASVVRTTRWAGGRPTRDHGDRRLGCAAARATRRRWRPGRHAHEDHQRPARPGQRLPVRARRPSRLAARGPSPR